MRSRQPGINQSAMEPGAIEVGRSHPGRCQEDSKEPCNQGVTKVPWIQEASKEPCKKGVSKVPWIQEASKKPQS